MHPSQFEQKPCHRKDITVCSSPQAITSVSPRLLTSGNTASAVIPHNSVPINFLQCSVFDISSDQTGRIRRVHAQCLLPLPLTLNLRQTLLLQQTLAPRSLPFTSNRLTFRTLPLPLLNPLLKHPLHVPAILPVHCWHHLALAFQQTMGDFSEARITA